VVDLVTGEAHILFHEVFTGTIDGVGAGQVRLTDLESTLPPAMPVVDAAMVAGNGELTHVRGLLHFVELSVTDPDPNGNGPGSGSYAGLICS
jgi:hypothetical protein